MTVPAAATAAGANVGGGASGPLRPWRALNRAYHGRRRLSVGSLLGLPLSWMLVIYLGSLVMLVFSALYELDPTTQKPTTNVTMANLTAAFTEWDTVRVVLRTAGVALLVTVICFLIALPVAFFVSKIAWRWARRGIVVAMLLPLWAGYLVKGYAWRAMVSPAGNQFAAAGSIFTFSLSLGDYIVPQIVNQGEERFLFGSVINGVLGAPNQPLAAALTLWPLVIIIGYLFAMKRLGAFENL